MNNKLFEEGAYIYENGTLVKAQECCSLFCGYYAAVGYNGEKAGNLFAVLSGPILASAYDKHGNRINLGEDYAGMSSHDGYEWYNE